MKYFCTNCNAEYLKWSGKCSACGQWDSLVEVVEETADSKKSSRPAKYIKLSEFKEINNNASRISSGFSEFDRVLGGGIVNGSISLLTGEPGVGKSTLLSQIAVKLSNDKRVLYISGEESVSQIYSRLKRISSSGAYNNLMVCEDVNIEQISDLIESEAPDLVIVDSIQSLSSSTVRSFAGSIGQVRVCGFLLTRLAKDLSIPIIVIGQINKDGNVAGPKVLEHIVDTVLAFEGGEYSQYRVLRALKNRFGATDELGVFEMGVNGMEQIENPSQAFLDEGSWDKGSALGAVMKGSRVVFVEVQALVTEKVGDMVPVKRVANGVKKLRLEMLCAVLSRKGRLYLGDKDVYVNVVGGVEVDDPSLDLAICKAIISSYKDELVKKDYVYYGEVGLTGEIRKGYTWKLVEKESKRLGYKYISSSFKTVNIRQV